MYLLIIRHAIAEDREVFAASGQSDELRPLTREGAKKMRKAVRGLKKILPDVELLVSSALTRSIQTADIVQSVYPRAQRKQLDALAPGGRAEDIYSWLQTQSQQKFIAFIGHEPDLGQLASWLLAGSRAEPFVAFKKGAVLLMEFPYKIAPGHASLCWALTSQQLRNLI